MKVLMVCLGNICRSPLAEGIFRHKLEAQGLDWEVQSAGTSSFHKGELPDFRSIEVARKYNLDITDQRSRPVTERDFHTFDYIFAMDNANLRFLKEMAAKNKGKAHLARILEFANAQDVLDVPDPYWDDNGFSAVFQMLENASTEVIHRIQSMMNPISLVSEHSEI